MVSNSYYMHAIPYLHDDEGGLDTRFEEAEKKTNSHERPEVMCRGRAGDDYSPTEHIGRKEFGDG